MNFYKLLLPLVFLSACNSKEGAIHTKKVFFDITGYFEKEAARLKSQNPTVHKIVSQNNLYEQREIKIADWETELALFTESDINKPAWKNSYRSIKNADVIQYLSTDNTLRTQKILIFLTADSSVNQISIFNKTSNALYTSTEELQYFPDSIYRITKKQDVRITGKNSYSVFAKFKNQ